jgi:hypothetical protein
MLRKEKDRQETKRISQAITPVATIGRLSCVQHPPQSRRSRKCELHALFGHGSQLPELFLRVGDCENQDGIDRLMNGRRCTPTTRTGMERSVPIFFHGSTDVIASSLGRSFRKHPATCRRFEALVAGHLHAVIFDVAGEQEWEHQNHGFTRPVETMNTSIPSHSWTT